MTHLRQRLFLLLLTVVLLIMVYLLNLVIPVMASENGATIAYQASPVLVPSQMSTIHWKAEGIAAIYFDDEGVVGEDSRDIVVTLCQSNRYALDVTLPDDTTLSLQIEPNILLFDPLFMSLLIIVGVQVLLILSRKWQNTKQIKLRNPIQIIVITCIILTFLIYLLLPLAELILKTVICI